MTGHMPVWFWPLVIAIVVPVTVRWFKRRRESSKIEGWKSHLREDGWELEEINEVSKYIRFAAEKPSKLSLVGLAPVVVFLLWAGLNVFGQSGWVVVGVWVFFIVLVLFVSIRAILQYFQGQEVRELLEDDPKILLDEGSDALSFSLDEEILAASNQAESAYHIETSDGISSSVYDSTDVKHVYFTTTEDAEYDHDIGPGEFELQDESANTVALIEFDPQYHISDVSYNDDEVVVELAEKDDSGSTPKGIQ